MTHIHIRMHFICMRNISIFDEPPNFKVSSFFLTNYVSKKVIITVTSWCNHLEEQHIFLNHCSMIPLLLRTLPYDMFCPLENRWDNNSSVGKWMNFIVGKSQKSHEEARSGRHAAWKTTSKFLFWRNSSS